MDRFTNVYLILIFLLVTIPGYCTAAVLDTACPDGNTDCTADNSECDLADTPMCKCSNGFKQNPDDDTKCIAVLTGPCSTDADCTGTVTNSECSSSICSCVAGYKAESDLCTKVLTGTCSTDADCTGTVTNSECSLSTCSCVAGYKAESNLCTKVLTGTCSTDADCTEAVTNSECFSSTCSCVAGYKPESNLCTKVLEGMCTTSDDCTSTVSDSECSDGKCQCKADFIEESHICKKGLGIACTDANSCVTNAECDNTCKCSPGFINTAGLCAPESSATSAWMTTSLIGTSLLILVLRII